jgi:hypothetical protein
VLAGARGGGLFGAAAAAEEQPRGGEGVDGAGEAEEEREAGDPGHEEEADGEGDGAAEHERHRRAEEHGRGRGRGHRRHRLPRRRGGGGHDGEQQRAELADLPRVVLAAAAAAAGTRHARWVAGRKRSRGPRPFDSSRAVGRWISAQARRGRGDSRRGVRQEEAGKGEWNRTGRGLARTSWNRSLYNEVGPGYCSPCLPQPGPRKLQYVSPHASDGRERHGMAWVGRSVVRTEWVGARTVVCYSARAGAG